MVIRAADKNGFSNTANVIDQITEMKENTLVVENDPPEVSFDTSKSSTIEDNGEKIYWYNTGDSIFSVKVTDVNENDKVCSGLASVKIIDEHNGIINVLDDKSFSENQENDYSFSTEISKLNLDKPFKHITFNFELVKEVEQAPSTEVDRRRVSA